jgi:hypothetical protein
MSSLQDAVKPVTKVDNNKDNNSTPQLPTPALPVEETEKPFISAKTQAWRDAKRNKTINRRGIAPLLTMATSAAQFIIDERPSDSANMFQVSAMLQSRQGTLIDKLQGFESEIASNIAQ